MAELWLACAIGRGDEGAARAFEQRYVTPLTVTLARMKLAPAELDEVKQLVRSRGRGVPGQEAPMSHESHDPLSRRLFLSRALSLLSVAPLLLGCTAPSPPPAAAAPTARRCVRGTGTAANIEGPYYRDPVTT